MLTRNIQVNNWQNNKNMVYNSIYFLSKLKTMLCIVTQSYLTLRDPLDCNSPGSSVHRIFQARILEWVSISSTSGSSRPKDQIAGRFFTWWVIKEAQQILDKSHCRYCMISHIYVESKIVQQTSDYNKKEADSENKLVVSRGRRKWGGAVQGWRIRGTNY